MLTLGEISPLLAIVLIFTAGYPAGLLARKMGIPAVTGNIIVGMLLGPSVLGVFDSGLTQSLEPISLFAMGLITAIVGGHLNYRRLHNSKRRILSITISESVLTFGIVTTGVYLVTKDWQIALILGSIAVATAPATVLAVIKEERAKGMLVKTLLATVALDNVLCIFLFSVSTALVADMIAGAGLNIWSLGKPIMDLGLSCLMGFLMGRVLVLLTRGRQIDPFAGLLMTVLMTLGLAQYFGLSPLLASLALGIMLGNSGRESEGLISGLEKLEPLLMTCFFTLAGVDIHLAELPAMGMLGALYFFGRFGGKVFGGLLGGAIGNVVPRVRNHLGVALLPQAGLAIGLIVLIQGDTRFPEELITTLTTVVLASVVIFETIGPPLVRRSLLKSEESGKDRRRIIEFLQEEYILVPLQAKDRWEAIGKLSEFLIKTHGISNVSIEELVESVQEREKSFSTAIGKGVALPHARLPDGPEIMGVMGISHNGIDFDSPDGEPVNFVILLATPEDQKDMHREVLRAVSRIMSDRKVRSGLFTARNAAEAYEVIEGSISQANYNYFLEEESDLPEVTGH